MDMTFSHQITSIQTLQQQVKGTVLTPEDADYEQARLTWNRSNDHHPALILIANDAEDISAGVRFASENGLGVAIQLTGHGTQIPADDSLLIITSRLNSVHVDAEARTAQVGAGVIWEQVVKATTPHGLAPLLGSSPHVGVVGYTLGGGIGWLARRFGLAADSVRWIEIVTPDGLLRRTSPIENSDLFWGLRGGGGNFGVVTALEFNLYPVETLYGGMIVYPGDVAGEALRIFRDWTKVVPEALTSSIAVVKFPSFPFVPEAMRGKVQVFVRAAFVGDALDGRRWMQPWLDWQTPLSNSFREIPFADVATISNDPVDPISGHGSNELIDTLSDAAIDVIVRRMTDQDSPLSVTELRHAGGAISRVATDANAISNRDATFYMQTSGLVPTPEIYTAVKAAISQYKEALKPTLKGAVYLNFMKGHEAAQRAKDAYRPDAYEKLLALKAKYDPRNMFRFSYQIVGHEEKQG
jgi:FAD/FMN-containing dehydrogenase